jgi:hypothetical protein
MDFPFEDPKTNEPFARLYPLHADNAKLKEAASVAPEMIQGSRDEGLFHFRLYKDRMPVGFDADQSFGKWATPEAKEASLAESADFRKAKEVSDKVQGAEASSRYPENIRYYPAINGPEGLNRDAFNAVVDEVAKEKNLSRKDVVLYNNTPHVKAFVSKIGPIPQLEAFQSDEAKAAWKAEGEKLQQNENKQVNRAKDVVDRANLMGQGKTFLAKYSKGLMLPSERQPEEREAVMKDVREASSEELRKVASASEREFKFLEKKLYAIQISAAQKEDPSLTVESFNKLKPAERRVAAKYAELEADDFNKLVRMKSGYFAVSKELNERGEHLTVAQARDIKEKEETKEKAKPVGEKGVGKSAPAPEKKADSKPVGRQSSKGAAAAAALASGLGRNR